MPRLGLMDLRHPALVSHSRVYETRRSYDRLISTMGFPILVRWHLYIESGTSNLTHWGRVTHICVSKITIIASDNGLSPGQHQAIIWTNAGIWSMGPLGTNFSEILIEIHTFSFRKMHLKMSSGKRRPFCLGLNVLKEREEVYLALPVIFVLMFICIYVHCDMWAISLIVFWVSNSLLSTHIQMFLLCKEQPNLKVKVYKYSYDHYNDVIMSVMASQITSLTIVYSTIYSGTDKRKDQSSMSLTFVRGIHRWLVNSPHKWPVTRKMFQFDDIIMYYLCFLS